MPHVGAMLLIGSLLVAGSASAQQPDQRRSDTTSRATPPHRSDRGMMMKMMESSEARLDQLVQAMNRATGQKKVDAMAAVINELVAQRKTMRAHMRSMMEGGGGPQRH